MTYHRRVLALAMDGAEPELIKRWAAEGTLPNIARLIRSGVSGTSRGLEHFVVGSTWPSLYTSTLPADHGHHSLIQLRTGSYDYYPMGSGDLTKRPPFWELLSRAGRRVAVLDVPLSKLSSNLNGIQTVEWGSHDAVFGFKCSSKPLEEEILRKYGRHPLGPSCDGERRSFREYEHFIGRLIAGVQLKTRLTLDLLRRERWDFFIQAFTESHCAGHQCWHLHDRRHPEYDPTVTALTGDPLTRVYAAIDEGIGEIVEAAGRDVAIVVFSAHGMGYWYGAQLLLKEILFKLGVAARPPPEPPRPPRPFDPLVELAAASWRRLPQTVRQSLAPLRNQLSRITREPDSLPTLGVDAARSGCFAVYNGLIEGGIRLNLVGREPQGCIAPGSEADAFCTELRHELLAIVDERTGNRLIRDVVKIRDVMEGQHLDDLPDLLVQWSDEVPTGSRCVGRGTGATLRAHSPRIGVVEGTNAYGRTGEHRADGFCVVTGPAIEPGSLSEDFTLVDYAPMFGALLGVELGQTPERRVKRRLLDEVLQIDRVAGE